MGKSKESILTTVDNFRHVIQDLYEYSKAAERATSLTGTQFKALTIIANSSYLRMSDLAHEMNLRPATIVGIIDRLEEKGLVTRSRSKKDRRTVELYLTENGLGIVSNANEVAQEQLFNELDKLSEEQFTCVVKGMELIGRLLSAEQTTLQSFN